MVSVRWLRLLMPPPKPLLPALPPVIVMRLMVTPLVTPDTILKMRKSVAALKSRRTVSRFAPVPWIVILRVMLGRAVSRLMVCGVLNSDDNQMSLVFRLVVLAALVASLGVGGLRHERLGSLARSALAWVVIRLALAS